MPAHARGDVGILKVLVVATSDTMVEQHYGCLCGSINGELQEALQRALQGAEPSDQVVVKPPAGLTRCPSP